MSPTPRLRNGYLSFGGRHRKPLKGRRKQRRRITRNRRGGFLGLLILGAIEKW